MRRRGGPRGNQARQVSTDPVDARRRQAPQGPPPAPGAPGYDEQQQYQQQGDPAWQQQQQPPQQQPPQQQPPYQGDQAYNEFPDFNQPAADFPEQSAEQDAFAPTPHYFGPLSPQDTEATADPFGFPAEKGRPHWQGTALNQEGEAPQPGAPPPPAQPPPMAAPPVQPGTPDPNAPAPERKPFGGGAPIRTDLHSQSRFQPDLQTRIFQNPFTDGMVPGMEPAGDDEPTITPGTAAPGPSPIAPEPSVQVMQPPPEPSADAGELVVFFSCHGGSGSTTVATNIAAAVASTGQPACIIDLDLQLGSVLTMLGIESHCPMSKVLVDMETYEWQMLAPLLARHHTGLCVLSQVGHIEELSALDPGRVPHFFRYLQERFKYIVVDGLRDFNDHALAAMDVADKIVLVTNQDVSSVRGAGMRIDILKRLGFSTDKLHLCLNRYDKRHKVTLQKIADALEIPPSFTVPNDYRTVSGASTRGCTLEDLDPEAKIARALANCGRALFDLPMLPRKQGVLSKLFGGGKKKPRGSKK